MLPIPATKAWSSRSGLSRPWRPFKRARNACSVNDAESGSGPCPAKSSPPAAPESRAPVRGSRGQSPPRPNLRMSRNRISRPSSSVRARWRCRSDGAPDGTTNSCPVILRWTVSAASSDSSTTTSLARRPTATMRRPAMPSANAVTDAWEAIMRGQSPAAPMIVAPTTSRRRSRATVSTSGSSGIGGSRSRVAGDDRHRLPVVAGLHVHGERHVQRQGTLHRLPQDRDQPGDLLAGHFEEQLVVNLQEQPRTEALDPQPAVDPDHGDLHGVCGGPLDGHVDGHPLPCPAQRGVRGTQLRDLPPAAEQRRDVALLA